MKKNATDTIIVRYLLQIGKQFYVKSPPYEGGFRGIKRFPGLVGPALPFDDPQGPRSRRVSLPQPNLRKINYSLSAIALRI